MPMMGMRLAKVAKGRGDIVGARQNLTNLERGSDAAEHPQQRVNGEVKQDSRHCATLEYAA